MKPERQSGCGWIWLHWLEAGIPTVRAAGMVLPLFNRVSAASTLMQSANNARQVVIALKSYASDHNGNYPNGSTSNAPLRNLFVAGILDNESIFTARLSPPSCSRIPSIPLGHPTWNACIAHEPKPGRAWKGAMIIIARNDGSVNGEKLTDDHSERVTLVPQASGENLFEQAGRYEV